MKATHKKTNLAAVLAALLLLASGCAAPAAAPAADASYPTDSVWYAPAAEAPAAEVPSYYDSGANVAPEAPHNTEEYSAITENGFRTVATSPLSTFSADVDTASYANIRRMIESGLRPEADAVRIEEMLNYFTYDYPAPTGEEPFSVTTELSDCPWNRDAKLLLIGLQADKIHMERQPASNLVFLLDVSGSMNQSNKLPLMKRAFILLAEQLRPEDRVSIVTYASSDRVVLSGATGDEKDDIMRAIENLTAGGSTAGSAGIKTAYMLAEEYFVPGGNNRIILGTDGDLNVGVTSEGALKRLVETKRQSGVNLSVMGFGTGNIKDNKMEALADNGNGSYSYIDDIAEARRVLVEELGGTLVTVAKDVKLQIEFNPAIVKSYRLIGYENRMLNNEDFVDDTKDAGELGSGHRVTALYEIIPVASPFEPPESTLKYQQTSVSSHAEVATVSVRYKQPQESHSRLLEYPIPLTRYTRSMSENMRLAAAVTEFGMVLRQSEYAGTASLHTAADLLRSLPDLYTDAYKAELLSLITAAGNVE